MLGAAGLCLLAVCIVAQYSASMSGAVNDWDYSYYAGPKDAHADNVKKLLSRIAVMQAAHPRLQRLYELLRRDLRLGSQQDSLHQVLDFSKTLRPKYSVNKLNRVYTTEPAFVAR